MDNLINIKFEPLNDREFLKKLDCEIIKQTYVKIIILDNNEIPIAEVQGKVTSGSLNINSGAAVRRTCSLSFVSDYEDRINLNDLLSINRRIEINIGLENHIDNSYPEIIWFPQGIFIITKPNIQRSFNSFSINLSCEDKMSLLNGDVAGKLPAAVTFSSYQQYIGYMEIECNSIDSIPYPTEPNEYTVYGFKDPNNIIYKRWNSAEGWIESKKSEVGEIETYDNLIFDIIQTLVCNYGGIPIEKIYIHDVVKELKQICYYDGSETLYYNPNNKIFSLDISGVEKPNDWVTYLYGDEIGYTYEPFTYPGDLISGIGDTVTSVLDKIINVLGNYEYFFDINGNFIFQEKRNYLNNSYDAKDSTVLDNRGRKTDEVDYLELQKNNLAILKNENYKVDYSEEGKIIYDFTSTDKSLIANISSSPDFTNIKNDFHVWGEKDNTPLHYHLVIKKKPSSMNTYDIIYERNADGEYNGRIRLTTEEDKSGEDVFGDWEIVEVGSGDYQIQIKSNNDKGVTVEEDAESGIAKINFPKTVNVTYSSYQKHLSINEYIKGIDMQQENGGLAFDIKKDGEFIESNSTIELLDNLKKYSSFKDGSWVISNDADREPYYRPADWRAELYLQGLSKVRMGQRPDIYEQELLDLFDSIYDFKKKEFKDGYVKSPNNLVYFFDYIEPTNELADFSVDALGTRLEVEKKDKLNKLYEMCVSDIILIPDDLTEQKKSAFRARAKAEGTPICNISSSIPIVPKVFGYSAQNVMRELLYKHINYNEGVSLTTIPIYYLEVNRRITLNDPYCQVYGDYIINSISYSFGRNTMSISAYKALERV